MSFLESRVYRAFLGAVAALSVFSVLQGCGSTSSSGCCQEVKLSDKIKEVEKVTVVPEVKGDQIVYVDRNVTIIQYVDRNITVIQYVDRNVTVDVIRVRPDARISGFEDGVVLLGDTLEIDSIESSDADGNVTKYRWTLDDENISTEKNPTIDLPTEEGSHVLCLEVTDNDELTSKMVCKSFTIPPIDEEPMAVLTGLNDNVIKTFCPVSVSGINSIANVSDIVSYKWTIDNNLTLSGADQNLTFDTLGEHEVCLEVIDSNDFNNTQCSTIVVENHDAPTPVLTLFDDVKTIITKDDLLQKGAKYDFSCAGSKDDCGNEEPMTCEWNAHSYRIDTDGNRVDFISDCLAHIGSPVVGKESWITLCSAPYDNYKYVEIELKITDQFGKSTTETKIFEVAP
ncbi:MAG TPA: hypothetical protein EYH01_01990 [Campylobacterales bacterium]|nr:hypothetical protein [Campylobacterales bacterium]